MIKTIESHKFYRNCWHYWHWYEFENRRKERKTTESGNTGLKLFVYKREWQQQLFRRSQTEQKTESEVVMHWYCWECVSVSASVWACVCMVSLSYICACNSWLIDEDMRLHQIHSHIPRHGIHLCMSQCHRKPLTFYLYFIHLYTQTHSYLADFYF